MAENEKGAKPDALVTFTGNVTVDIPDDLKPLRFNGQDVTDRLWELAGAFDGSQIRVRRRRQKSTAGNIDAVVLGVKHDFLASTMRRELIHLADGSGVVAAVENVEFVLKDDYQDHGIGRLSLQVEAYAAHQLGFKKIIAMAEGHAEHETRVGYKVWPKLGYDVVVPPDLLRKMPSGELRAAGIDPEGEVWVSEMLDKGVFRHWETFGEGCIMELDVSSLDSPSMRRLFKLPPEEQQ